MKLTRLGLFVLLGGTLSIFGCGSDSGGGDAGTGGTGGTGGGDAGFELADCDPAENPTHCIRCAPENLPAIITALFATGLAIPVTVTGDPDTVTAGDSTTVELSASTTVVDLPTEVSGSVNADSTATYEVTTGGTGTADIEIPEGDFATVETPPGSGSYDFTVDAGTGDIDVDADDGVTEVIVSMVSATLNLTITSIGPIDLAIEAGAPEDDLDCFIDGDGLSLTAAAPL